MSTDPFEQDAAAYALGTLDGADLTHFEEHLADCAECRGRVAELRPVVAALALVPAAALEPPPDTVLPALLRAAARERTRRRRLTAATALAAAVIAIALAVLWPDTASTPAPPAARQMQALVPNPVHATAALVSRKWGTEIELSCRYEDGVRSGIAYRLVVVDTTGSRHDAGSWSLVPGRTIHFTGGTDVPRTRIRSVQITLPDGRPILALPG